jgi:hypothetical protein
MRTAFRPFRVAGIPVTVRTMRSSGWASPCISNSWASIWNKGIPRQSGCLNSTKRRRRVTSPGARVLRGRWRRRLTPRTPPVSTSGTSYRCRAPGRTVPVREASPELLVDEIRVLRPRLGGRMKAGNVDVTLTLPCLCDVVGRLHAHERVHFHAERLLEAQSHNAGEVSVAVEQAGQGRTRNL